MQSVVLADKAGLVRLNQIAVDGTKIKASASKHSAMSYARMKKEEDRLTKYINDYPVSYTHLIGTKPISSIITKSEAMSRFTFCRLRGEVASSFKCFINSSMFTKLTLYPFLTASYPIATDMWLLPTPGGPKNCLLYTSACKPGCYQALLIS